MCITPSISVVLILYLTLFFLFSVPALSDAYPQHVGKHIRHLQTDTSEVVGYVMPSIDEMESSVCVHGIDPAMQSDSRRNMFFLGKLLHSLPAMFQADVGVCRRTPSSSDTHRQGDGSRHGPSGGGRGDVEVALVQRLLEAVADVVLLARPSSSWPRRRLSYTDTSPPPVSGRSGGGSSGNTLLASRATARDDCNTYRIFGLLAVMDLSEQIDYLLKILTYAVVFVGLIWLVCVLLVLYHDAISVMHKILSSTLLTTPHHHSAVLVDVLLLCWLPLYPPGCLSAASFNMYFFVLLGSIVSVELFYLLVYYTPPQRRAYLGLTKGNSALDMAHRSPGDTLSNKLSPTPSHIATDMANNYNYNNNYYDNNSQPLRTPSYQMSEDSPPPFARLESVLSFTTPNSDSPMRRGHLQKILSNSACRCSSSSSGSGSVRHSRSPNRSPSTTTTSEHAPLLTNEAPSDSQPRTIQPSYGTSKYGMSMSGHGLGSTDDENRSRSASLGWKASTLRALGGGYGALEMAGDEYDV